MHNTVDNKEMQPVRSPLFYVGDKYKLMPQLSGLFPSTIENYIEPFVGGGSSFLNITAKNFYLNDLDEWVIKLHRMLNSYLDEKEILFEELYELVAYYGLTCSIKNIDVPAGYRQMYKKTYFAHANKDSYIKLREDFNSNKDDVRRLYLLLIYGFNHMIRFNSKGNFNLPVGNVDFNKNVYKALSNYLRLCAVKKPQFFSADYKDFIKTVPLTNGTFIYFDPPYLISSSEYNKYWNEKDEYELYSLIDALDEEGVKFGITNLLHHKGETNTLFDIWRQQYISYDICSNYISFNDNTIKTDSREVYVTNYDS